MYRNAHAPGRKSSASKSANTIRRTDDALANAGRDKAFPESESTPQFLREAKDSFRIVEEVRWQLSGARQTAAGNQKGERRGVYQFYTPSCVVRCLVDMLAPYKGRICDPACGSGGMFVQSEKFVESHGGKLGDISIYGQESNATTRRLAIMNLAIRGIEADIGKEHADLRVDYVLANPSFNYSDWFRKVDDLIKVNANFGVHFLHQEAHPRSTVQNIPRIHEHN
jgi:type I restriction-modification system DNA methylase subunit